MMIQCDEHGFANALLVSPDIKELIDSSIKIKNIITIDYVYEGDVVDTFYLSDSFGKKYGYDDNQKLPLPDEYPDWTKSLLPICEKCFTNLVQLKGADPLLSQ